MASLVKTLPQAFLEVLHVGRNCCHFFPDVLFQIHRCSWFLFVHLALEISLEEKGLRKLVPMNVEVPTKYPLSQDRIVVFEIRLHTSKARCSTDQRSMATEMLWVSLEERSRTNSPRQRFHSQLFCKIVRYFCRTMYIIYVLLDVLYRRPNTSPYFYIVHSVHYDIKKNSGNTNKHTILQSTVYVISII